MNPTSAPVEEQPAPATLEPWVQRVVEEFEQLSDRVERLGDFLDRVEQGAVKLDPISRTLLVAQHGAMTAYQGILSIRLNTKVQPTE